MQRRQLNHQSIQLETNFPVQTCFANVTESYQKYSPIAIRLMFGAEGGAPARICQPLIEADSTFYLLWAPFGGDSGGKRPQKCGKVARAFLLFPFRRVRRMPGGTRVGVTRLVESAGEPGGANEPCADGGFCEQPELPENDAFDVYGWHRRQELSRYGRGGAMRPVRAKQGDGHDASPSREPLKERRGGGGRGGG